MDGQHSCTAEKVSRTISAWEPLVLVGGPLVVAATVAAFWSTMGQGTALTLAAAAAGAAIAAAMVARWRRGPFVVAGMAVAAYAVVVTIIAGWALACPGCGEESPRAFWAMFGVALFSMILALGLAAITVGGVIGRRAWRGR